MRHSQEFIKAWQEKRYQDAQRIARAFQGNLFKTSTFSDWRTSISSWLAQDLKDNHDLNDLQEVRMFFQELSAHHRYKEICENYIELVEQKQFMIAFQAQEYIIAESIGLDSLKNIFSDNILEMVSMKISTVIEPQEFLNIYTLLSNVFTNSACAEICKTLLHSMDIKFPAMMAQLDLDFRRTKAEQEMETQKRLMISKKIKMLQNIIETQGKNITYSNTRLSEWMGKYNQAALEIATLSEKYENAVLKIASLEEQHQTQFSELKALQSHLAHKDHQLQCLEEQLAIESEKSACLLQKQGLLLEALERASKPRDDLAAQLERQTVEIRQLQEEESVPPVLNRFGLGITPLAVTAPHVREADSSPNRTMHRHD